MDNNIPVLPEQRSARNLFRPAVRSVLPLRIAIAGASGAGKTLGALRLASGLVGGDWSQVYMLNTEPLINALGYVNDPVWNIGQYFYYHLSAPYNPRVMISVMRNAVDSGAGVLLLDTLTQAWAGTGGVRDLHDSMEGNVFTNWAKVNPIWDEFINYITFACPIHVICTIRSQIKYVLDETNENGRKKTVVNVLGLAPVLRPETEYEFPIFLNLRRSDHRAEVVTMRGSMLDLDPITQDVELSEETGANLQAWAMSGQDVSMSFERPQMQKNQAQSANTSNPDGENVPKENGKKPGSDKDAFWGFVHLIAAHKRMTRKEAMADGARVLKACDQDYKQAFPLILAEWEIDLDELPKSLKEDIKVSGFALSPLLAEQAPEAQQAEQAPEAQQAEQPPKPSKQSRAPKA